MEFFKPLPHKYYCFTGLVHIHVPKHSPQLGEQAWVQEDKHLLGFMHLHKRTKTFRVSCHLLQTHSHKDNVLPFSNHITHYHKPRLLPVSKLFWAGKYTMGMPVTDDFLQIPTKSVSAKSSRSQAISPKEEEFIGFLCHTSSGTWFLWSYRLQRPAFNYFSGSPKPAQVSYGYQQEHEPGFKVFEVITVGTDNYLLPF